MSGSLSPLEPMARVDCAWLRMDEPDNLMIINGVLLFDESLGLDEIRQIAAERLLSIPRFRQRVVPGGRRGRPHWELDPAFDLDAHVVEESLPGDGGHETLQNLVSRRMSEPLDPARPLWQARLISNYRGGSAILWRLHHCIGDGIALMLVLLSLTDIVEEGEGTERTLSESPLRALFAPVPLAAEAARSHLEKFMPAAVKLLTGPAEKLGSLSPWTKGGASVPAFGRMALRRPDPKTVFKGPLGVPKCAAWSRAISLADVETVRRALGGTVNDVLTAAVTGALRRYLEARGTSAKGLSFRTVVPVSLRPLEQMASLGNQFGLVFLSLPVGLADPTRRLSELRRRMATLKRSFEPFVALRVLGLLGASPRQLQKLVVRIFGAKGTAVMTNVPGPQQVLYLGGRPIRGFVFWVPQSGRLGMGISISSYAGQVRLGIATDQGLVSDPERIVAGFEEEIAAMHGLAAAKATS